MFKWARRSPHAAIFGESTVFYMHVFQIGRQLNLNECASLIMNAGLAEAAARPFDDELWLAPRFKYLAKTRARALAMQEVQDYKGNDAKFKSLTPRARLIVLGLLARGIFGLFKKTQGEAGPDASDASEKRINDALRRTIEGIDESMDELRFEPLLQCMVDRKLYEPSYIYSGAYVRLRLRGFQIVPRETGLTVSSEDLPWVNVSLLLHKSGVAILSFEHHPQEGLGSRLLASMLSLNPPTNSW